MTLRVVGAGLGRTGTNSLKVALEKLLGEPCYHMIEVGNHVEHPDAWAAAFAGEMPDWDNLLAGYGAAVDWPSAWFWEPLSRAYADALILLSNRDPDAWWKSASTTIFLALETYFAPDAEDNGWTRMGVRMMNAFTPDWRDEAAAKAAFVAHNERVRATAPADRLLEWKPSDGWGPICDRLGVAVPDEPFPHTNTAEQLRAALGLDGAQASS